MDFHLVTSSFVQDLESAKIRYAVIGGFALGLWGAARATIDMDFLLLIEDAERIDKILERYDYQCIYKTENVGQYVSSDKRYGSIDFIFSSREISKKMLDRSIKSELASNHKINVLKPEDIIGLKVQAFSNDPKRKAKDLADIEALLKARQNHHIDWQLLEEYFLLFEKQDVFWDLKETYAKP